MPLRTCLGCRLISEKSRLIRFVADSGVLRPDFKSSLDGRGVYICPEKRCLDEALRKDAFSRAFRKKVAVPDRNELWAMVEGAIKNKH